MQTTSNLYKQLLAEAGHTFEIQLLVGAAGSETTIDMEHIDYMRRFGAFSEDLGLIVGAATSQCLQLTLRGVQNSAIPRMGRLRPQIRVVGADGVTVSEWIDLGIFFVDTRQSDVSGTVLDIVAYDAMLKADSIQTDSLFSNGGPQPTWSRIFSLFLSDAAASIGTTLDFPFALNQIVQHANILKAVQLGVLRDTISRSAACCMCNAMISASGQLRFVPIASSDPAVEVDVDDVSSLGTPLPQVTRVVFTDSRTDEDGTIWEKEEGSAGGTTLYAEVFSGVGFSRAKAFESVQWFVYRPNLAEDIELDPALELGDVIETGSNTWMVCSMDVEYGTCVVGTIAAPNAAELDHEYPVQTAADATATQAIRLASSTARALDEKLDADDPSASTVGVLMGTVDSTSTATAFTATIPGITDLHDGVAVYLTNGVVTSASGWTLDVNGLGAKPVYQSQAAATRTTTIFNTNYSMLFIYNESRVSGGCWDIFYGYNSDTNTLAYNIRRGNGSYLAHTALNRYMVAFSKDETTILPVTAASNTTGTSKTLTSLEWDPFGPIYYYATTTVVAAGEAVGSGYLYTQYSSCDLRYAFNVGKTLTANRDVFIVCVPQSNGKVKLHSSPISQSLPTTEDGLVYIRFGHAYSTYQVTLDVQHPAYQYKSGRLQLYTGAA